MTAPQKPFVDPTELTPEQWGQYRDAAMAALKRNPKDREALDAIRTANDQLSIYDAAEAASPGERISQGVSEGLHGLGEAALDVPRSIAQTVMHPIQTIENLPQVPGALVHAIASNDPEAIARGVGNIGGVLLPFAKAKAAGSFALTDTPVRVGAITAARGGPMAGTTVGQVASRTAGNLVRGAGRTVGAVLERPQLRNQLLRLQIENAQRGGAGTTGLTAEEAAVAKQLGLTADQVRGRVGIRVQQLPVRGEVSASAPPKTPGEAPVPPLEPIPGTGGRGFTAEGPPTPPVTPANEAFAELRSGIQRSQVPGTYDQQVVAQALERATRKGARGEGRIVPAGPTQRAAPATRMQSPRMRLASAAKQLATLSDDELRQAEGLTSDNPQLLRLIQREIARRAKP